MRFRRGASRQVRSVTAMVDCTRRTWVGEWGSERRRKMNFTIGGPQGWMDRQLKRKSFWRSVRGAGQPHDGADGRHLYGPQKPGKMMMN